MGSCLFVFVKHPFDVGDRVRIDNQDLIVDSISLLYTVFIRVDLQKKVQIPNLTLNALWIENTSRSGVMKERVTLQIGADNDLGAIKRFKNKVHTHLQAPENRRDFYDDVDVELVSITDMSKLEVSVEARHKVR